MTNKQQLKINDDYISFGDFARNILGQQCQYASQSIPNLGNGLRFKNLNTGSYHDIKIHKDDTKAFETRYKKFKEDLLK